jgi:hypothetical protein
VTGVILGFAWSGELLAFDGFAARFVFDPIQKGTRGDQPAGNGAKQNDLVTTAAAKRDIKKPCYDDQKFCIHGAWSIMHADPARLLFD